MKNDEPTVGRRVLLRAAVFLGIAAASGLLTGGEGNPGRAGALGPTDPATPSTPGATPGGGTGAGTAAGAAGAPGHPAVEPPQGAPGAAYRLQPMTGDAPARRPPNAPLTPRTRPVLELPLTPGSGSPMVLTFDDGPDPRYTPGILDTLARYQVRAMFFVCGEMATEHRDLVRRISAEGHAIGNHTWSHPLIPRLSRPALADEIVRTSDVVQQAVGEAPRWFRAPYGAWNRAAFEIGAELGMEPLAWTVDTLDWKEPGTTTIVSRVLRGAAPGVIVLNHDAGGNRAQSVQALRAYLPQLLDRGYRLTLPSPAHLPAA
ncbi:polysaccharide deacetylase family protein [Streptomyces antimicrobicus]|uniref:Polysaccharide deacetylase family protein n=1 Tax=Streptomyces antimicrobicus TaxID=2883108 RepID=A0ABS8B7W0_9ACTN|nr:polysaccharide deacetylase family protein [Streptomyces antimicrobicus]MCB5180702.1 polysaccharide deacetylase family protein [Streptomyces antimicrobicus]